MTTMPAPARHRPQPLRRPWPLTWPGCLRSHRSA